MAEPLVEISVQDWPKLRDSFRKYQDFGVIGYNLLATLISTNGDKEFGFRVYCPYGEMANGIVAFIQKAELKQLIIISSYGGPDMLEAALLTTSLVTWPEAGIESPFVEPGAKRCLAGVAEKKDLVKKYEGPCRLFVYRKNKLFDFECPPEVYFSPVKAADVPRVNQVWPHKYPSSDWLFHKLIDLGLSYGLYTNDHRLVAWMFVCEAGFLTHLYCEEECRKRGYAEMVVKQVVNDRLSKGLDSFCYVVDGNVKSSNLFLKVGFDLVGNICWMSHASKTSQVSSKI